MAYVDAVTHKDAKSNSSEPVRTLEFLCKCGCGIFRMDVTVYGDGSWDQVLRCANCDKACEVTEPKTNGPH